MPAVVPFIPLITGAIGGGAAVYGAKKSTHASEAAARYQANQANYAADLEAKSSAEALAFAKEQEAARHNEYLSTQDRNKQIYDAELARDDDRYNTRQNNLAPYRAFGVGAIGQLMRPLGSAPGSIGSMMGGR
jgi:Flp pilus assembly protein TadG